MAVAFVQNVASNQATTTGPSLTLTVGAGITTTAGHMLSVGFRVGGGNSLASISDSKGNTTWQIDDQGSSGNINSGLASCIMAPGKNLVPGDTVILTWTASAQSTAQASEYSGVATGTGGRAATDQSNNAHSGTTADTVATPATSQAGDLVLSVAGSTVSANAATFTLTTPDPDSGGTWVLAANAGNGLGCGYQIGIGSASLYSAGWTASAGTATDATIATYQAATAAAPLPPPSIPVFPAGYGPQTADFTGWVENPFSFLTRGVVFRGHQQVAGGQALTGGGYTIISYDTIDEDPYSGWSAAGTGGQPANSWLAPWTGSYEITVFTSIQAQAVWVGSGALVTGGAIAGVLTGQMVFGSTAGAGGSSATFTVQMTGGVDYVQGACTVAANANTSVSSVGRYPGMEITYVSE